MAFPTEAFINARKYQVEQADRNNMSANIGRGIGQGVTNAFNLATVGKVQDKQRRLEEFKLVSQNYMFIDTRTNDVANPLELAKTYVETGTLPDNIRAKSIKSMYTPEQESYMKTRGTMRAKSEFGEGNELDLYRQKKMIDIDAAEEKKKREFKQKVGESKVTSQYNLNLVSEVSRDLSDLMVKGYEEGGAGNVLRAGITSAARSGYLPAAVARKYKSSGAIIGKRNELLMKMFPMLTQQIGKEGSIRLIESVLDRIGQTLPDTQTPPDLARTQMEETLKSMYRINRALYNMDLKGLNEKNQKNYIDRIATQSANIQLDDTEQQALDNLVNTSLSPLDNYLGGKGGGSGAPKVGTVEAGYKYKGGDPSNPSSWERVK